MIDKNHPTKGFHIKGKSSTWGRQSSLKIIIGRSKITQSPLIERLLRPLQG
ncbi:anthrax toxin-like adenylyl cyclase domain-containing protein [Janthinobacterium sp. B9-8]|uniref:anthrax toxin-like adenylyl cyclase domain-containing protein n=1 Tax=Janthinobacterium sp. B9-8 TaxID=1236179 RepID=UPI0018D26535